MPICVEEGCQSAPRIFGNKIVFDGAVWKNYDRAERSNIYMAVIEEDPTKMEETEEQDPETEKLAPFSRVFLETTIKQGDLTVPEVLELIEDISALSELKNAISNFLDVYDWGGKLLFIPLTRMGKKAIEIKEDVSWKDLTEEQKYSIYEYVALFGIMELNQSDLNNLQREVIVKGERVDGITGFAMLAADVYESYIDAGFGTSGSGS